MCESKHIGAGTLREKSVRVIEIRNGRHFDPFELLDQERRIDHISQLVAFDRALLAELVRKLKSWEE